jgi:polar amino acid transport system substrate-binding protein
MAESLMIYTEVFPPDQYVGHDGKLTGYAVEIVQEIQRRTGNQDPIQLVPWARGYREAQQKPGVVLFSVARLAERDSLFEWIGPIKESVSYFYVKSGSKAAIDSLEQAKSLERIGVYKDDVRDQYLVKAGFTNLDRSVDQEIILKKLLAGRIDAMASVPDSMPDLLSSMGLQQDSVRPVCPFLKVQIYITISKASPQSVVRSWAEAFGAMKADDTFQRIYRKYYPNDPLPGPAVSPF